MGKWKNRKLPMERFIEKFIILDNGCWQWTKSLSDKGYGTFYSDRSIRAHVWIYEQVHGKIPEGLQIDHKCRNRGCVNPDHLEAVTPQVNILRGDGTAAKRSKQTHCIHGHEFTVGNTYIRLDTGARQCRTCSLLFQRARIERLTKQDKN